MSLTRQAAARALLVLLLVPVTHAQVPQPPLQAYADLPDVDLMQLSPDGKTLAFAGRSAKGPALFVYDIETGAAGAIGTDKVKPRRVGFAGNDHVIMVASDTKSLFGYSDRFEYSAAYAYGIKSGKIRQLLRGTDGVYPAQEGLGRVLGKAPDSEQVFMPAYMGEPGESLSYSLLRVNLDTGRGRLVSKGNANTIDWFVDAAGEIVAREDYNNRSDLYSIHRLDGVKWTNIYEVTANQLPMSTLGLRADRPALIVGDWSESGVWSLYELGVDNGELEDLTLAEDSLDVEHVVTDRNRVVLGVEYAGLLPRYEFFHAPLRESFAKATARFEPGVLWLESWSADFSRLLLRLFDGYSAGYYIVYDARSDELVKTVALRDSIPPEAVGEVAMVTYKARDGLEIPSLVTWPAGVEKRENLPLIVMPHGGPSSYDRVGFHWRGQYFANRGYVVLQPNFRGSTGFGAEFFEAGHGEWGAKMQDDITDGVNALVAMGAVDPQRVCIVGASYGGYAALAGGAFTSDLYRCVAAIAPVTDVERMLAETRRERGRHHWVVDYWENLAGSDKEKLRAISPVNYADSFAAPVLLIHGKDDTVVPIRQSVEMEKALRKAGKEVELVRIKGADHWQSRAETRLATLEALHGFIARHLRPAE